MSYSCERLLISNKDQCFEEKETMKTLACLSNLCDVFLPLRSRRSALFVATVALLIAGLMALAGCSSGSSAKPQVGAIVFTDENGSKVQTTLTSLTVGQGTYLDVPLTNDSALMGADWSVSCASALAPGEPLPPGETQDLSCGSFTPAHTLSGPVPSYATSGAGYVTFYTAPTAPPKGGTVTLYASATIDHSRYSSVTLTINGLPISIGFAAAPPSTLVVNGTASLKAVLSNDYNSAGATWSASCSASACGSFSATQAISGIATTYTAPSTAPAGGLPVTITATSVADSTKSVNSTIVVYPISVSVSPATLSVQTNNTGVLTATVTNDVANKGVDWSVSCTNTTTPGNCGTILPAHTASGAATTYTAPPLAQIPVNTPITIKATSTTDSTKSATATVTTIQGQFVSGTGQAAQRPIRGATVSLYAASTSATELNTAANAVNASATTTATTDENGNFSIPYGYECPSPDTQMALVSTGGNAGGGTNPNLVLMAALGPCSQLGTSRFVINEATTVAAIYALSGFITDAQHVGSASASSSAMAAAFGTAKDLVDATTGLTRTQTVSGAGIVPQEKIDTLANLLSACAKTAGSSPGDGSVCDRLFKAASPGIAPVAQPNNTEQAVLDLARSAIGQVNSSTLFQLATSDGSFQPALSEQPGDWTLSVSFPNRTSDKAVVVDDAGNIWIWGSSNAGVTEFVGAASSASDPRALISLAAAAEKGQE